jgi:hypothetical protein
MSYPRLRLPISTRHAFALAFDLAFRRDAVHSLLVPLALRAPWIVALALLPPLEATSHPGLVFALTLTALLGDYLMLVLIGAMLRFRAQSVYNTPHEAHPAAASECYARGLRRVPWLIVTEIVRNLAMFLTVWLFVFPSIYLAYRLSCATEAVVLDARDTSSAFQHSFRLTQGRFERWLEMVVVTILLVLGVLFVSAIVSLPFGNVASTVRVMEDVARVLVTGIAPVIQYAWTFFYLRLREGVEPAIVEPLPAYAAGPPRPPAEWTPPFPLPPAPTPEPPTTHARVAALDTAMGNGHEAPPATTGAGS